jgi:hypothetical protein
MAQNAETKTYKAPGKHTSIGSASITYPGQPSPTIDPFAYGKNTGKANAQTGNVPSVQVGGSFEVGSLPDAFTGDFGVGDDKNVSTPVSG